MLSIQGEVSHAYAAPIDCLEAYFEAQDWQYDRAGDEEIVAHVEAAWGTFELRGLWRHEDHVLQFVGLTGLKAEPEQRPRVYELIGLINEGLWLGHFDLWTGDGTILFRHAALVTGDDEEAALSYAAAETMAEAALDECDRYYPAFEFLLGSDRTPAEALKAAMTDTAGEA